MLKLKPTRVYSSKDLGVTEVIYTSSNDDLIDILVEEFAQLEGMLKMIGAIDNIWQEVIVKCKSQQNSTVYLHVGKSVKTIGLRVKGNLLDNTKVNFGELYYFKVPVLSPIADLYVPAESAELLEPLSKKTLSEAIKKEVLEASKGLYPGLTLKLSNYIDATIECNDDKVWIDDGHAKRIPIDNLSIDDITHLYGKIRDALVF